MTRVIFDYIDEQKGEESRFLTDENGAFEDIRQKLEAKTHDKAIYATINKEKIKNKLMKQAKAGGVLPKDIRNLYLEGTSILRLESMQKDVFSNAEISTAKEKRFKNTKPSNRPPKRKNEDEISSASKRSRFNLPLAKAEQRGGSHTSKRKATESFGDNTSSNKRMRINPSVNSGTDVEPQTQDTTQPVHSLDRRCLSCQAKGLRCNLRSPCSHCKAKSTACRYSLTAWGADEMVEQSSHSDNETFTDVAHTEQLSPSRADGVEDNEEEDLPHSTRTTATRKNVETVTQPLNFTVEQQALFVCEICEQVFQDKTEVLQHKRSVHRSNTLNDLLLCGAPNCQAAFTMLHDLDRHSKAHEELDKLRSQLHSDTVTVDDKQTRKWISIMKDVRLNDKDFQLIRRMHNGQAVGHMDVSTIRKTMQQIQGKISWLTLQFFKACNIPKPLDCPTFKIASYETSLIHLLETMYGDADVADLDSFEAFMKKPEQELETRGFVEALIGAAVTKWALQPMPQGEIHNYGLLYEYNEWLGEKSKTLQSFALEEATREYLRNQVKPTLSEYGHSMATEMLHILRHFIPLEVQKVQQLWPEQARATAITQVDNSEDEGSLPTLSPPPQSPPNLTINTQWPPKPPKDPKQVFFEGLWMDVFEKALDLRVEMEIKGNAQYRFYFPLADTALNFEHHVAHYKTTNVEISEKLLCREAGMRYLHHSDYKPTPPRTILVGLSPVIKGYFKDFRDGPWRGEWVTICQGRVHLWKPNKERELASRPLVEEGEEDIEG